MKTCPGCKETKALSEFTRRSARCKPCRAAWIAEWRRVHPEETRQMAKRYREAHREQIRATYLRHREMHQATRRRHEYGLTAEQYAQLTAQQEGVCAICRRRAQLLVDHDHESGVVRGLLCLHCNSGLGQFRDNPQLLQTALAYLLGLNAPSKVSTRKRPPKEPATIDQAIAAATSNRPTPAAPA